MLGKAAGVYVKRLEDDKPLQDAVLSVHHAFVLTLGNTHTIKIIQNHDGGCFVNGLPPQVALVATVKAICTGPHHGQNPGGGKPGGPRHLNG